MDRAGRLVHKPPMRRLQSALLLLLCAVLPLSGNAGWRDVRAPCAMGQGAATMGPCCEHHDPAQVGGPTCKAGADCQCVVPAVPQAFVAPTPAPMPPIAASAARVQAASFQPAAVWRPPTSL